MYKTEFIKCYTKIKCKIIFYVKKYFLFYLFSTVEHKNQTNHSLLYVYFSVSRNEMKMGYEALDVLRTHMAGVLCFG